MGLRWYVGRMTESRSAAERGFLGREPLLVGAVVAIAIVLRLPDLFGWWPNPDEGIYYGVVTRDGFRAAMAEALATSHPPLYFVILRALGWLSTDFTVLRSVSLVSACVAVYVFILVGRELGGEPVRGRVMGLFAGLVLAVSPRAIVLSQVIRPYMLFVLLLSASLLFLLRYLREPSTGRLVAHTTCSLLAMLVHYSAVFGLGVLGILVLFDGARRGTRRREWRRLFAAQLLPATLFVGLYFGHLRRIAASPLGEHALEGWLAPYMIHRLADAWLGFVGVHAMLVGNAWAAPAALFTIGAAVAAVRMRGWDPVFILAASALGLGILAAALHLYPFGPTRHAAWLIGFVAPLVAWGLTALVTSGRAAGTLAVPLVVIGLVGARLASPVLDPENRPRATRDHVLRRDAVEAMSDVLDSSRGPRLVVMSTEAFLLLTPLYPEARQSMEVSRDGQFRRFRWGVRDVLVLPGQDFVSRPSEIRLLNHLYTGTLLATQAFGIDLPTGGEPLLVLEGGWRFRGMNELAELARRSGPLGTTTSVPGLVAVYLDFDAYGHALGVTEK